MPKINTLYVDSIVIKREFIEKIIFPIDNYVKLNGSSSFLISKIKVFINELSATNSLIRIRKP